MKFASKQAFLEDVENSWEALAVLLKQITDESLARPGLYAEVRGGVDVLTHVHEWHNMCLRWYRDGLKGMPEMPAPGFTWGQCPALNEHIYEQYKDVSPDEARRKLRASHRKVLKLLEARSERELLEPGYYAWCGKARKLPLTSYFHPNTSGHYRWAQKKLKRLVQQGQPTGQRSTRRRL
ncbi:MAG: ClbS/DfsB family four-helix bundle protein [Phycisphaerae bacterium]|nr:ClbS/DfsB family four-helix bundle protein [Phycisphaerae bacterium]